MADIANSAGAGDAVCARLSADMCASKSVFIVCAKGAIGVLGFVSKADSTQRTQSTHSTMVATVSNL